jgi:hypothetical protein
VALGTVASGARGRFDMLLFWNGRGEGGIYTAAMRKDRMEHNSEWRWEGVEGGQ